MATEGVLESRVPSQGHCCLPRGPDGSVVDGTLCHRLAAVKPVRDKVPGSDRPCETNAEVGAQGVLGPHRVAVHNGGDGGADVLGSLSEHRISECEKYTRSQRPEYEFFSL